MKYVLIKLVIEYLEQIIIINNITINYYFAMSNNEYNQ